MAYTEILYTVQDRIAHITLNRPDKRNALSFQLREELTDALRQAERDDNVTVILLSGAGTSFCSGYDITPDPSGMTFVRTPDGSTLGMTYQRPDGWWSVFVTTADGNRKIVDRGNERAAIDAIWAYADRQASDPIADDPGVDAFFEMIHAHAA